MTRGFELVAEAMRIARSQPAPTAITALIVAAVSGVIVATTGQTVAAEREILSRIDDAGTRTIVVEDRDGRGELDAGAVERLNALDGIEWAVGFGIATDVQTRGLEGASAVPIRSFFGALPGGVATSPWREQAGTAIAGRDALSLLGFGTAAGPVVRGSDQAEMAVVGWLIADPPLEFLNRSLITIPADGERVARIVALATSAQRVPGLSVALASVLDSADPTSVSVQTSESLVQVRAAVQGQIGTFGRNIVSGTLAAGLVLTALNVLGAVTARRRDFGRRRALGASRVDIVALVAVQTVTVAIAGALCGGAAGTAIVHQMVGSTPPAEFTLAVGILAVISTAAAALPPAVLAAYRDPVRVLRVP